MVEKLNYDEPFNFVISIDVKDLERAERFYTEILGFKRGWDKAIDFGWLEINLPMKNLTLGLNLIKEGEVVQGSTSMNIGVKDAEETKKYLDSKGVKTEEIRVLPGMVKMVISYDPDGNMVVFVESLVEE